MVACIAPLDLRDSARARDAGSSSVKSRAYIKEGDRRLNLAQGNRQLEEDLRAAVRSFASSINSSRSVVADMSALARVTAALPLENLAYWEQLIRGEFALARRTGTAPERSGWRALFPFCGSAGRAESSRVLTWIDLSSGDGRVRERTLRTLAGPAPNSFFLSLAARRLNDWVPQVRAAARDEVPRLAQTTHPEQVVDLLCASLPTWTSWGRAELLDRQVMMELISMDGVASALRQRVIGSAAGPMAAALSQALRTAVLDEQLLQIAREAVQPAVRAKAYRTLLLGKAVWVDGRRWQWTDVRYCQRRLTNILADRPLSNAPALLEVLNAAAADRSSIVRRVAAEALVREMSSLGGAAAPLARRFADDPSLAVAERGEFVLKRLAANPG
jgi:hypothetical protein